MVKQEIKVEYYLLEVGDFSEADKQEILSFAKRHRHEWEDDMDLAREIADNFCFRDWSFSTTRDPQETTTKLIREELDERIWDRIYDSEVECIYKILQASKPSLLETE